MSDPASPASATATTALTSPPANSHAPAPPTARAPAADPSVPGIETAPDVPGGRRSSVRIERGVAPPPSAYPRIDAGSAVTIEEVTFPDIPGIAFPRVIHEAYRADYGPRFLADGVVDIQPPVLGPAFPSLVSQVDANGNEIAGIRPIEIRVPLATYTPWHLRSSLPGGNGELTDFWGMFLPFSQTANDREAVGDSRPSVEERYSSREEYLEQVEKEARAAVGRRHLLEEDVPRVLRRARELWDWMAAR